jgi:hypothetical protein
VGQIFCICDDSIVSPGPVFLISKTERPHGVYMFNAMFAGCMLIAC